MGTCICNIFRIFLKENLFLLLWEQHISSHFLWRFRTGELLAFLMCHSNGLPVFMYIIFFSFLNKIPCTLGKNISRRNCPKVKGRIKHTTNHRLLIKACLLYLDRFSSSEMSVFYLSCNWPCGIVILTWVFLLHRRSPTSLTFRYHPFTDDSLKEKWARSTMSFSSDNTMPRHPNTQIKRCFCSHCQLPPKGVFRQSQVLLSYCVVWPQPDGGPAPHADHGQVPVHGSAPLHSIPGSYCLLPSLKAASRRR